MEERRNHPRAQEKADVTVRVQSSPEAPELEGTEFSCESSDVSLSGVMLWIDIPIRVGAFLELEIFFNDSTERYLHTGNVVWVNEGIEFPGYHTGIRFSIINNPQFSSWQETISKLLDKIEKI
jgi:hypothetical protein